jgi:UDP-N-acetylglucosamine transferase subunit ALG13
VPEIGFTDYVWQRDFITIGPALPGTTGGESVREEVHMIFVTVGSWRFDGLVKVIDQAVGQGAISQKVTMQIGNGTYLPVHCEYFRTAPSLGPYFERASLVIAHGGFTTIEILMRGLPLLSVANPDVHGNHQHAFLDALDHDGYVVYCRNLDRIAELVNAMLLKGPLSNARRVHFFPPIAMDLECVLPQASRRHKNPSPWLLRLLNRSRASEGAIRINRTVQPDSR